MIDELLRNCFNVGASMVAQQANPPSPPPPTFATGILHFPIYPPYGCSGITWFGPKAEARNSFWVLHRYQEVKCSGHHLLLSRCISRELNRNRVASTQIWDGGVPKGDLAHYATMPVFS